jgi:signal transduction histidine kinase
LLLVKGCATIDHMETRSRRRALFHRSRSDRLVAGVAGGIAERLKIDPIVIRLAFVVLAFAGGLGIVLYLLGWLIAPAAETSEDHERTTSVRQVVSIALVVSGLLVLCREAGLWFSDAAAWSVGLAAFGSAILWTRPDTAGRGRFAKLASKLPRTRTDVLSGRSKGRLVLGIILVAAGMSIFLAANTSFAAIRNVAFAVMVTAVGLGLALGPWMYDVVRQLGTERRERIRSEERAEVAAHLHDSVLQTLAMIQRAPTREEMTTLARGQERELRAWLYGRAPADGGETLRDALDAMAARIESLHRVPVDVVAVGDIPMDERLRALVDAAGEATTNGAKHSGASIISVFAETGERTVTVYVRDEGKGFEAGNMPGDRRGITESIVGRMERNGGSATITSNSGEGTEVHLEMPRLRP